VTGTDPQTIIEAVTSPPPSSRRSEAFGDGNAAGKIRSFLNPEEGSLPD